MPFVFRDDHAIIRLGDRGNDHVERAAGPPFRCAVGHQARPDEAGLFVEREWRIIRNFNDAALKAGSDQYGKEILLFAIPPDCIQRIVIGHRSKSNSVEQIRGIVRRNPGLSHVKFQKILLARGAMTLVDEEMMG